MPPFWFSVRMVRLEWGLEPMLPIWREVWSQVAFGKRLEHMLGSEEFSNSQSQPKPRCFFASDLCCRPHHDKQLFKESTKTLNNSSEVLCDKSAFCEDKLFGIALQLLKGDVEKKGRSYFYFWPLGNFLVSWKWDKNGYLLSILFRDSQKISLSPPQKQTNKQTNKQKRDKQESENKQQ